MADAPFMLVRIKPSNKKVSHSALGYEINKVDGWCKIPFAVAMELKKMKMNELNPEASPPIFDVLTQEEAESLDSRERVRIEPAGTVSAPKEKLAAPTEEDTSAMPPAAAARRRGRGPSIIEGG
jgi:hypothetical protein